MNTPTHSPAPWKFRGSYLRDADGNELAAVVPFRGPISQDLANRALIEVGPEMYRLIHDCHGLFQQSPLNKDNDWLSSQLARDLRAVVAKVEGHS